MIFMIRGRQARPNGRLRRLKSVLPHKGERQWLVELNCFLKWSSAQRVIMVEWESGMPLGARLFGATACFKRDVLRIEPSDLHKNSKQTSLGIKDWSCASGMFVIIMSAEIYRWKDFARVGKCQISWLDAVRQCQMNVSGAKSVCWHTMVKDNDS